jgi:hypothetical protein
MAVDLDLAKRVVDYLNELTTLDKPCIGALIANHIPCNQALADHPTCQVSAQHGGCHVGLLGLLNGLCGSYDDGPKRGWGAITAVFEEAPKGQYTCLKGFDIVSNEEIEAKT